MEHDLKEEKQEEQTTETVDQPEQSPGEPEQIQPASGGDDNTQEQNSTQETTSDAEAEKTVQAAEVEATKTDPDGEKEEKEDKEEQTKQEEKTGQTDEDTPKKDENLASDIVNQEILHVAAEANVERDEDEEEGDPDRAFDTLDDLKKLGGENIDENDPGATGRVIEDRKAVLQLRKGNLYKAVIFAKMLENGQNPAGEEKKLDAQNPAAPGGRFSRFVNSSKLDKAGKVLKTANAVSGLAGMADSNYKSSRLSGLIGTANDVLILVNSIRSIIKKLRDFKKNSTSTTKKVFAVIGLVSDFGMAISKGASLAQKLADRRGWKVLSDVLGYISTISGIAGQTAALMNVCNTIKDLAVGMKPIKKAQEEEKKRVVEILKEYEPKTAPADNIEQAAQGEEPKAEAQAEETKAEPQAAKEEEPQAAKEEQPQAAKEEQPQAAKEEEPKAEPQAAKEEEPKAEPQAAKEEETKTAATKEAKKEKGKKKGKEKEKKTETEKKSKRKRLREKLGKVVGPVKQHKMFKEKILSTLERPDVSGEDKAVLASYLGRARMLSKRKLILANASTGLITATMGLGATLSKTGIDYSPKDAIQTKKDAGMSALVFGGLTNSMMLASNLGMSVAGKKVNGGPGEREGNLIKEGLYGALHDLGDEQFGLRKIAANLTPENPSHQHLQEAENARKRYETTSKQFTGSGVNYAKLFAANNLEAFKNSLVASL